MFSPLFVSFMIAFGAGDDPKSENAQITDLTFRGRRDRHLLMDLDGDGRLDLIVVTAFPAPISKYLPNFAPPLPQRLSLRDERRIDIFWNSPDGFHQEDRSSYIIPRSARSFTLADVLPAPGKEIIIFDEKGARAATPRTKDTEIHGIADFVRICSVPSFFDYPSETSLPDWNLVIWGAAKAGDAPIVPTADGFVVLRPSPDPPFLRPAEELNISPIVKTESSNNRYFSVVKSLPRPFLADIDGDGNVDFFVCDPSGAPQMIVYFGKSGGRFAREAAVRPSPSLRREIKSDNLVFETAAAVDLNKDGICDFIVSRTFGNIGLWDTLQTSQLVYFGRKGSAGFDPRPDQVVSSVGVSIVPRAIDFDGDGYLDILVSSYRTDLLTNVKNAIFNSARVSYFLFLMENGKYPENPTVERAVDLDFKVLERGGVEPRAYFHGDFDGDGVKDLLAVEQERLIRAYKGNRRRESFLEKSGYDFANNPMMILAVRATTDLQIMDLDGDGRSEVILPDAGMIRIIKYAPK